MAKTRSRTSKTKKKTAADVKFDASLRFLILHGPEAYLQTEYLRRLRENIGEAEGEVDVIHFDGATTTAADVLDEIRSLGLMQQYKIVVVDSADAFVKIEGHRAILERYAESPVQEATLVLRSEGWRPGNLDKAVAKIGAVLKCAEPSMPEAVSFCMRRCEKRYETTINPDAANLLVERIGPVLARLDTELGRLAIMCEPGAPIDMQLVRDQVAMSREERAWEIQSVLLTGEPSVVVTKLRELIEVSRQPTQLIAFSLSDLARKLYAASRLLRAGQGDQAIASQLKLWGASRTVVLGAARRLEPEAAAALLHDALAVDVRSKTGRGEAARSLEMLALRFVRTIGRVSR